MVRQKYRYFLAEIHCDGKHMWQWGITSKDVYHAIRRSLLACFGDFGLGAVVRSLSVKYLNPQTKTVILRCKRDFYCSVNTAMTLVTDIGRHIVRLHTLHVSGTIRSCQKFLIRHIRQQLPFLLFDCQTQDEKEELRRIMLSTCVGISQFGGKVSTVNEHVTSDISVLMH